jgi:IS4 transposase
LYIRDLGYFALDVLSNVQQQEAYFLSRLNFKTIVYEQISDVLIELDFGKLYRYMKQNKIPRIEKQVLMGKEDKLPVRMVIELMPDQIYEQRVRKVKAYNRKKGHQTSTGYTDRARFNLFVTNANEQMLTARAIPLFYKVRWQVELIFKIWKSTFRIHITRKMKIERFLCLLYSKLLLIMINWEIILVFRNNIYAKTNQYLSIDKCFKTLKDNADKLYGILINPAITVEGLIHWVSTIFESKHWLEKRKNKMCYEEIINLNY